MQSQRRIILITPELYSSEREKIKKVSRAADGVVECLSLGRSPERWRPSGDKVGGALVTGRGSLAGQLFPGIWREGLEMAADRMKSKVNSVFKMHGLVLRA